MPERKPRKIAEQNPTNYLRRSPRFLPENQIAVENPGTSKPSARKLAAPDSFSTPPCSNIAKTLKNGCGTLQNGGKKDAKSKSSVISRRKSARLDNTAAFSCLDKQKQHLIEKRVTRSSIGGIRFVNYKENECDEISGKRDGELKSLQKSGKGSSRSARLDDRVRVCKSEEVLFSQKQYLIEKRLTRSSLGRNKAVIIEISDSDSEDDSRERVSILSKDRKAKVGVNCSKKNIGNIEKRVTRRSSDERKHGWDDELSKRHTNKKDAKDCVITIISGDKNGKRKTRVGEKRKKYQVEEECDVDHGWTKEQELALRRAYFTEKPTPQFWKKVARTVPGKSAKECFNRIHSDHSTPSQPPTCSRPKRKEPSPISYSASKLLSPAEMKSKKLKSRMRTLVAQKTVRQLLQKQHNEDQDYEADLFSVLESTIDQSPLYLQEGAPFASPATNQGSSSAQRKQRSRLNSSRKAAFVSPPVLKQIKNKALHEKYIDRLHCRDAKRKAAALMKAKKDKATPNDEKVSLLKPNLVKVAKDALVSDAQHAITRLRSLQLGTDYSIDGDDSTCLGSDEDEDELC